MKKGNLYKNKDGVIIVCTEVLSDKYFSGTVLKSSKQKDVSGITSDFFHKNEFEELIGDLTLNNVMNGRV